MMLSWYAVMLALGQNCKALSLATYKTTRVRDGCIKCTEDV